MPRLHVLTAAACAALWLGLPSAMARADDVAAAIAQVHEEYIEGLQNGNAAALAALFTDDATELPSNAPPVRGRAAIRADYERTFHRLHVANGSLRTAELVRRGDIVYETGRYSFDFETDGKYSHSTGRYLTIWRRVSGVWKMDLNLGQQEAPV